MKCCGINPRLGTLIIAILGVVVHALVLAWGAYANKTLYILIPGGLSTLFYIYLLLPLGTRKQYLYLPFLVYTIIMLFLICCFLGFLIYTQIKWPNFWKTELIKMLDRIVKEREMNFDAVNYTYMGFLIILFIFNLIAFATVQIAYSYEAVKRRRKHILPSTPDFGGMPYANLDVNGPNGVEPVWTTIKL